MTSKDLSEKLAPVLEAAAERIHYAETRRTNYTVMAVALIAGGISILVFASGSIEELWLKLASVTAAIGFSGVGIAVLYAYGAQTNQYPYTGATTTWKWFYRDGLPKSRAFKPGLLEGKEALKARITSEYSTQLSEFKTRMGTLTDENLNADQDLEQLYSLHVNELYKNLYLTTLRKIFNRGLMAAILSIAAAAVIGLVLEAQYYNKGATEISGTGWTQRIEYRPMSAPLSSVADVSFHVIVSNSRLAPLAVGDFYLRDMNGWPINADIKLTSPKTKTVSPKGRSEVYLTARVPRQIWNEAHSFGLVVN